MRSPCFHRCRRSAFTLIELLVATSVLILLVVMVVQLVGGVSSTTTLQRQQLDAARQARLVFDRMAADFAGMVRRPDVDCSAYKYPNYRNAATATHFKRTGNDSILFLAQADSQASGGTVAVADEISLVGYRVFDNNGSSDDKGSSFRLERLGRGFGYSEAAPTAGFGMPLLTFSKPTNANSTNPVDLFQVVAGSTLTTYFSTGNPPSLESYNSAGQDTNTILESHVLGQDVFRMEFALLMKDDQGSGSYFLSSASNYLDYTDAKQRGFAGVSAIVVTIAILDQGSRQRFGDNNARYQAMNSAAGKLEDGNDDSVATKWSQKLLTDASLPKVFKTSAYVYQRYFYLR